MLFANHQQDSRGRNTCGQLLSQRQGVVSTTTRISRQPLVRRRANETRWAPTFEPMGHARPPLLGQNGGVGCSTTRQEGCEAQHATKPYAGANTVCCSHGGPVLCWPIYKDGAGAGLRAVRRIAAAVSRSSNGFSAKSAPIAVIAKTPTWA